MSTEPPFRPDGTLGPPDVIGVDRVECPCGCGAWLGKPTRSAARYVTYSAMRFPCGTVAEVLT